MSSDTLEEPDGKEALQAGRDRREAPAGGCYDGAGPHCCGCGEVDRRERRDLSPLMIGVRRAGELPGPADEGSGTGEQASTQGGVGPDAGQADPAGGGEGKLLSSAHRRRTSSTSAARWRCPCGALARRLAEAGYSAKQIAAVTGRASLREVERYTLAAEQETLARDVMSKII